MSIFERHLFVCQNRRPPGSPKGCCAEKGAGGGPRPAETTGLRGGTEGPGSDQLGGLPGTLRPGTDGGRLPGGGLVRTGSDDVEDFASTSWAEILARLRIVGPNRRERSVERPLRPHRCPPPTAELPALPAAPLVPPFAAGTCPGAGRGTPTPSGSPRSCCSRPRSPRCCPTTSVSWIAFPTRRLWPGRTKRRCSRLWSGLGYYRRARSLRTRRPGRSWNRHGGRLPADVAALRRLPGIGRYTAGAIASIAFDLREPVLDGNVERVLSRLLAVTARPRRGGGRTAGAVRRRRWCRARTRATLNQALMELGALICTPRRPGCADLPGGIRRCRAHAEGRPGGLSRATATPRRSRGSASAWPLVRRAGRVLLERPLRGSARSAGPGTFPPARSPTTGPPRRRSRRSLADAIMAWRSGCCLGGGPVLCHGIMHRRLAPAGPPLPADAEAAWRGARSCAGSTCHGLEEAAVSGATRKVLRGSGPAP